MIVQHSSVSRFSAQRIGCENDAEIEFVEWDDFIATINVLHTHIKRYGMWKTGKRLHGWCYSKAVATNSHRHHALV